MNQRAEQVIKSLLKSGVVFYFPEHSFKSKEPHYFVVLNNDPLNDKEIVMVNATTEIQKRKDWVQRVGFSPETLVELTKAECPLLKKDSVFDCNSPLVHSIQTLVEKYRDGNMLIKGTVSVEVLQRLKGGICKSPKVIKRLKKLIS